MSIFVSRPEGKYEAIPTGVRLAVCVNVFDIGWHPGFEGRLQRKVVILWELADRKQDGSRFQVTKSYTASLGEKANLLRDLESWRGSAFTEDELKRFDLEKLIGAPCQLNLVDKIRQDGRKFAEIVGVMRLSRGQAPLDIETGADYIPEWVKKEIASQQPAPAHEDSVSPQDAPASEPLFNDDIPF